MNLDGIPENGEQTWIWDAVGEGFDSGRVVANRDSYTGFLLYVYGIKTSELRAAGEPSYFGDYQSTDGVEHQIRRSGSVSFDERGNYNMLGWLISTPDHEWWKATNLAAVQHDLYSIAHHEIGHSLIFHPNYDRFGHFANIGIVSDADVAIYHGDYPNIDRFYHLPGTIDRLSGWGAFGNEFHNDFPYGRWLVTKLDLLVTQSVGYDLRFTSPFVHLSFSDGELVNGSVMKPFIDTLSVIGGIPPYYWTLEQGKLPSGLSLDSFTGTFFGTPAEAGSFDLTVRVREYSESSLGVTLSTTLTIGQ